MGDKIVHHRQIVATQGGIYEQMHDSEFCTENSLMRCLAYPVGSKEYINHLMMVAISYDTTSRLVYRGKGEYKKLPERKYRNTVFSICDETPEYISVIYERYKKPTETPELELNTLRIIADTVSCMMASDNIFMVGDYACIIDYLIRRENAWNNSSEDEKYNFEYPKYDYKNSPIAKLICEYIGVYVI